MEMGTMVHQEILLSSLKKYIVYFLIFSFFSCQEKQNSEVVQVVKSGDENLQLTNGTLLYNNVPFTGVFKHYDALNKTNNETHYAAGYKEGLEVKKYDGGIIAEERFYKKGLKRGIHKGFWEDGSQKFEFGFNEKGSYEGSFREWYRNGQLVKQFNFVNGKENGSQKMWQPNGKIRANYVVKNGERFGLIGLKKCYTVNVTNEKI